MCRSVGDHASAALEQPCFRFLRFHGMVLAVPVMFGNGVCV